MEDAEWGCHHGQAVGAYGGPPLRGAQRWMCWRRLFIIWRPGRRERIHVLIFRAARGQFISNRDHAGRFIPRSSGRRNQSVQFIQRADRDQFSAVRDGSHILRGRFVLAECWGAGRWNDGIADIVIAGAAGVLVVVCGLGSWFRKWCGRGEL